MPKRNLSEIQLSKNCTVSLLFLPRTKKAQNLDKQAESAQQEKETLDHRNEKLHLLALASGKAKSKVSVHQGVKSK
jgi:hypothetical protein